MKSDLKRYLGALLLAVLGVLFLVLATLGLTVLRPADQIAVQGQAEKSAQAVFTKAGVLALFRPPVTVTAQAEDKTPVTLVVGRAYDVAGYAASLEAAEIKGLQSWTELEITKPARTNTATTPEVSQIAESDLWLQTVRGEGSVSVTLDQDVDTLSVMAYTTDSKTAPSLRLHWAKSVSLWWQWVALTVGILMILVATMWWLWMRRQEAGVAQSVAEDETSTTVMATVSDGVVVEDSAGETPEATSGEVEEVIPDEVLTEADDSVAIVSENEQLNETTDQAPQENDVSTAGDGVVVEESAGEMPEADSEEVEEVIPDETLAEADDSVAIVSENEQLNETTDQALPENEVSTAGSIADEPATTTAQFRAIHAVTGEIVLPTRSALRNARERGETEVEVDGVRYPTGTFPTVQASSAAEELTASDLEDAPVSDEVSAEIRKAESAGTADSTRRREPFWRRLRQRNQKHSSEGEKN